MKQHVEFQTTVILPSLVEGVVERTIQPVQVIDDDKIREFYFYGEGDSATIAVRVTRDGKFTQRVGSTDNIAREQILKPGQRIKFSDLTKEITFWLAEAPESRNPQYFDIQFKPKGE
jgi:hypothetical protein